MSEPEVSGEKRGRVSDAGGASASARRRDEPEVRKQILALIYPGSY